MLRTQRIFRPRPLSPTELLFSERHAAADGVSPCSSEPAEPDAIMARVGCEDSFSTGQRASSSRPDDELHVLENGDSRSDRRRASPRALALPEPLMTGSVSQGGVSW